MQGETDLVGKGGRRVGRIVLWRQGGQLAGQGSRVRLRKAVRPLVAEHRGCCSSMPHAPVPRPSSRGGRVQGAAVGHSLAACLGLGGVVASVRLPA